MDEGGAGASPRGARKREGYGGRTAAGGAVRSCAPHSEYGTPEGPDPEPAEGLARGHAQIQIKFAIKGINTYLGVCL